VEEVQRAPSDGEATARSFLASLAGLLMSRDAPLPAGLVLPLLARLLPLLETPAVCAAAVAAGSGSKVEDSSALMTALSEAVGRAAAAVRTDTSSAAVGGAMAQRTALDVQLCVARLACSVHVHASCV
jgi:hypothetical protein